jgi:hypothetical protein
MFLTALNSAALAKGGVKGATEAVLAVELCQRESIFGFHVRWGVAGCGEGRAAAHSFKTTWGLAGCRATASCRSCR